MRAFVPAAQMAHGVDVIGAVGARELEDFGFAVGEFDNREISLAPCLCQISEFAFNAPRAFVVDNRELRMLAPEFSAVSSRIVSVDAVGRGVDRNRNASLFDDFDRAFLG